MLKLFHKIIDVLAGNKVSESTLSHYIRLQQLCQNHQPIQIKLKGSYELHQSLVLSVDQNKHELVIDDLFPPVKAGDIKAGDTIEFICQTPGQEIKFFTRVIQRCKTNNKISFRLVLPRELGHNHNRSSYRVYVDTERDLRIHLNSDDSDFSSAKIANLSINGIKLYFANNIQDKLVKGVFFDNVMIHLPSGYNIDCQIEIKNCYLLRSGLSRSVAGGSLKIPNPQHKKKLQQYLATVQREQRRRENRDL